MYNSTDRELCAVPVSGDVSVGISNVGEGLSHLHSVWLKVSLTQLETVLEQWQSLHSEE